MTYYNYDCSVILVFRIGVSDRKPEGRYWGKVDSDVTLKGLDFGANNEVIGVSDDNIVYSRLGISEENPGGKSWKRLTYGYRLTTVSTFGYWLIRPDNVTYFSNYQPSRAVYQRINVNLISGKFKKISAGFGNNVWALDEDNNVFRRKKVNTISPSGTGWEKIDGFRLLDIAAGYNVVYGITLTGKIVKFSGKKY